MIDLGGKREKPTPYDLINYLSPQSFLAKYLVVVVEKGITGEVMHFISFDEAKNGYEPEEINKSDYYDVSIWEWTEDRYQKIYGY